MNEKIVEHLSKVLYHQWRDEKLSQGYHHPSKCPNFEEIEDQEETKISNDVVHCNKCLATLIDYDSLSEYQKNLYREKAESFYLTLKMYDLDLVEIKR
jgi:hypothetical protein